MPAPNQDLGEWASSPFPLIPTPLGSQDPSSFHGSKQIAHSMAHLHNCLIRSLNSIYLQAPYVTTPTDIADMLQLAKLWHDELHHHHTTEEEVFFPGVEEMTGQKGIMEANVVQHEQFEPGLDALYKYATETKVEEYDASKLRAIIDSFGDVLTTHLNDEISTLLSLEKYDSDKIMALWNKTHQYVLKTCDPKVQLPILCGSFDKYYEGKAIGLTMPWFLYYLVHYWHERKYRGSWRFLPCNTWGEPRPLPFMPVTKTTKEGKAAA